jgi:AcrR family transcriptional regulator
MVDTGNEGRRLTNKGRATRDRIIEAAATLMSTHTVSGTSIDDVRKVAGVSGSQMQHYFADKRSLVRGVVAWQADSVVELSQLPVLGQLDSFEALDLWAELNIARQRRLACQGGCGLGSLAGELVEQDSEIRADLAEGFERWEALLRDGLRRMRKRGDLSPEANPDELALSILAALQGGMLLTQTKRDVRPVEVALKNVIAHVRSFATDEAERTNTRRKPGKARVATRLVATL